MKFFTKMIVTAKKIPNSLVTRPTPITYIGAGKIKMIADIFLPYGVKKALVVTDKPLRTLGLLDSMLEELKKGGIETVIFDDVQPDPTYTTVRNGLEICRRNDCQGIIAFGGGSVIDSSKAISAAYSNNVLPEKLEGMLKVKSCSCPFIVVPTTAGTGSETTIVAVISDSVTHKKSVIIDPKLVPDVTIIDPELTIGLPKHITAFTAIDALTHAVEAYVSEYATEKTRQYSEASIKLIYKHLTNVYNNPDDLVGREALLMASFYGGMAFTRTYVGYVHAFAHNIGGKFSIPHGLANAVLLPHIMRFYLPFCQKDFARLADITELCDSQESEERKAELFVESLQRLNDNVGIPRVLDKFPKSAVKQMRIEGFKECHGSYPVPRYLSKEEADKLLMLVASC